ncbi:MAG: GtrA family protein [Oscillospiraceae bacterium]|nr:GtrA family protein [Oscillospiraceae bacterium]
MNTEETKNVQTNAEESTTPTPEKNPKKEILRSVKFLLFSISAGVIQLVSDTLLAQFTDWPTWLCYLIGLILSVLWNFTLNRRYTFKSASNVPIAMTKVAAFYAVFTPASTYFHHCLTSMFGVAGTVATIINMLANFILEFLYDRFFVFGKSLDTNDLAKNAAATKAAETEETSELLPTDE